MELSVIAFDEILHVQFLTNGPQEQKWQLYLDKSITCVYLVGVSRAMGDCGYEYWHLYETRGVHQDSAGFYQKETEWEVFTFMQA